mmetsp:Transcript_178301/g.565710  ORF Transcript_178301/g.565710 Transcript_178301/m.565710 type:complete len:97 (-) Transcript_178301:194-484(-)
MFRHTTGMLRDFKHKKSIRLHCIGDSGGRLFTSHCECSENLMYTHHLVSIGVVLVYFGALQRSPSFLDTHFGLCLGLHSRAHGLVSSAFKASIPRC